MKHRITEQTFYKYLKCPSWISRELERDEDLREKLLEKIQDDGLLSEHEKALLTDRDYVEVTSDDLDEAALQTLELMKKGAQTIYKGILIHENWVGRPDILERVEGKSRLGDYYYVACDIKRSRHMKDEYKFQGLFYAKILDRVQGHEPVMGYVLHADGNVESYLLEEFDTHFHLTMDAIEEILDGGSESHFLTSGCKQSPYFSECELEARNCDDLSRLNRIWRSEVDLMMRVGITSVEELANAPVQNLKEVHGMSLDRLYFLQQQAIAMSENKVIRIGEIELPKEEGPVLVVDVESDPLRNSDYLIGVLLIDNGKETYHPFLAKRPEDEEKAWHEFTEFITHYPTANMYHYGWYEVDVFRRLTERYGAPEEAKRIIENQMLDLLSFMRQKVIFPMSFYSLKDIAKYLGFKWRMNEASGLDSVLWYEEWLENGDTKALEDIVNYNEDDVRATWLVRNWAVEDNRR
ncbi:MAG: TM0106 family RecB-like putative nuclease [Patescibacteria group bacterium]|nr:TM0106 family RecB-like putative nuclease [Patescibacteria group bacterium]